MTKRHIAMLISAATLFTPPAPALACAPGFCVLREALCADGATLRLRIARDAVVIQRRSAAPYALPETVGYAHDFLDWRSAEGRFNALAEGCGNE